eukprot:4227947-Pyramimonas_sp.AAC.3
MLNDRRGRNGRRMRGLEWVSGRWRTEMHDGKLKHKTILRKATPKWAVPFKMGVAAELAPGGDGAPGHDGGGGDDRGGEESDGGASAKQSEPADSDEGGDAP